MALKVTGLSTMLRSLERLAEPDTIRGITREAVRQGGAIVHARMVEAAPYRDDDVTRETSNALKPGELKDGIKLYVPPPDADGRVKAIIGPSASVRHVARWVDRGHWLVKGGSLKQGKSGKLSGRGRRLRFVSGNAFFRRSWEATKDEARAAVVAEVRRQVQLVKKGQ